MKNFLRAALVALATLCAPAWATQTVILASGNTAATSSDVTVTSTATLTMFPGNIGGNNIDLPVYAVAGGQEVRVGDLTAQAPLLRLPTPGVYRVKRPDISATGMNVGVASDVASSGSSGTIPSLGQATAASSLPVVPASDWTLPAFTSTPTFNLGTLNGAATAAKQPALGTAGTPSTDVITVQGSASGTALPVSSATLATAANQSTANSSLSTIATNTTGAATAANQTNVQTTPGVASTNVLGVQTFDDTVTGQSGQISTVNNILTTTAGSGWTDVSIYRSVSIELVPTGTVTSGTVQFEGSNDGVNANPVTLHNEASPYAAPSSISLPATNTVRWVAGPLHFRYLRARISVAIGGGGSIQAFTRYSTQPYEPQAPIAALINVGTSTALSGNGVTGAGSQRITIAADNSALPAWGHGATGSAAPAGATQAGGAVVTSIPTASSSGVMAGIALDHNNAQWTTPIPRELRKIQATSLASTGETTVVTAGASGVFNDLRCIHITTAGTTAGTLAFKDATGGSTIFTINYPNAASAPSAPYLWCPTAPLPQTTAANNWTVTASSNQAYNITIEYDQTK